jgi:hypothetical protein
VLPIDKIKDFMAPVSLIVNRVNKEMIERIYKLKLPDVKSKYFNASTFLQIYAAKKGMVTGRALPNEAQAARLVLKDYVNGKLLFCNMRPDYDPAVHGVLEQCGEYRLPNAASTI